MLVRFQSIKMLEISTEKTFNDQIAIIVKLYIRYIQCRRLVKALLFRSTIFASLHLSKADFHEENVPFGNPELVWLIFLKLKYLTNNHHYFHSLLFLTTNHKTTSSTKYSDLFIEFPLTSKQIQRVGRIFSICCNHLTLNS